MHVACMQQQHFLRVTAALRARAGDGCSDHYLRVFCAVSHEETAGYGVNDICRTLMEMRKHKPVELGTWAHATCPRLLCAFGLLSASLGL